MKVINFLQINDWEPRKFLSFTLLVHLALLGCFYLDYRGISLPIVRPLIGSIYLFFIPGTQILRLLNLHRLGNIRAVTYTIGLSISLVMFSGFFINSVLPYLGIYNPISFYYVSTTLFSITLALSVLCYLFDDGESTAEYIDLKDLLKPLPLFLFLLPLLSILGTLLVNLKDDNLLLMIIIPLISLLFFYLSMHCSEPKAIYPIAILSFALSLIYAHSLISMYLVGNDIQTEYYYSNLVVLKSYWDSSSKSNVNSMLSTTIFPPIYLLISSVDLTWIFKFIYPTILGIQVLSLYELYRSQTNEKIAFMSCFFFISFYIFYTVVPAQENQLMAQLYLILFMLASLDRDMRKSKRSVLLIIFSASLTVCHYGLSYIFLFCLIISKIILSFGEHNQSNSITSKIVMIFFTLTLLWYSTVSGSSLLDTIISIFDRVFSNVFSDFLNPETAQGMEIIAARPGSLVGLINKGLHLLLQFFITVGILATMMGYSRFKLDDNYRTLSYLNYGLCLASIALPYFSSAIWTARLYFLNLIFIAPFSIIGGLAISRFAGGIIPQQSRFLKSEDATIKLFAFILALFLLFDSSWVREITQQSPNSFAFSQKSILNGGNPVAIVSFYTSVIPEQDVYGSIWVSRYISNDSDIHATYSDIRVHSLTSYGGINTNRVIPITSQTKNITYGYVFLQSINLVEGLGNDYKLGSSNIRPYNITDNMPYFDGMNLIYSNNGNMIYY